MTREQFKGRWKRFKGELKKHWGRFTNDNLLQIEGDYDTFIGSLQERYGEQKEQKDRVRHWVNRWYHQHQSVKSDSMPKTGRD